MVEAAYFHVEKGRLFGIVFFVVGITGLCATWIFAAAWDARIVLTIIFGLFAAGGLPALIGGGYWRSRFDNGHVYWECPSRFYGKNDSCCIQDVVEFQQIIMAPAGAGDAFGASYDYRFVMKDGTMKDIEQQCFGDVAAFFHALQEQNPRILLTEKDQYEERYGGTLTEAVRRLLRRK